MRAVALTESAPGAPARAARPPARRPAGQLVAAPADLGAAPRDQREHLQRRVVDLAGQPLALCRGRGRRASAVAIALSARSREPDHVAADGAGEHQQHQAVEGVLRDGAPLDDVAPTLTTAPATRPPQTGPPATAAGEHRRRRPGCGQAWRRRRRCARRSARRASRAPCPTATPTSSDEQPPGASAAARS